jgi:hypothetical protein
MHARRRRIIISSIAGALAMIGLAVLQGPTDTTAEEKKAAATGTPAGDNATFNYSKISYTPVPR